MNIFILDPSPVLSARLLGDDHLNKMILESCQMLANCFTKEQLKEAPLTKAGTIWKYSHYNHPCSKWVRESKGNYTWLCFYVDSLLRERRYRFPKRAEHDCKRFYEWALIYSMLLKFPVEKQTPFVVAIPENAICRRMLYFDEVNPIRQYQGYYAKDKKKMHKWTKREKPPFIP